MLVFVFYLLCLGSFVRGGLTSGVKEDANMKITRSCIEKERQTLLVLKTNLVYIDDNLQDWGSEEEKKDCCRWVGVRCSNRTGHVIGLNLSTSSNGVAGNISTSIPLLYKLQYLNLRGIDFQSNHLPNFLGSLTNLRYLKISAANLSGPIPHQLANLSNLLLLDLSFNFLTGPIPASLGELTSLRHLDLSGNQLEGVIPNLFGNRSSLVQINLSKNLLNGSVPSFAIPSSMKEVVLEHDDPYIRGDIFTPVPKFKPCLSVSDLALVDNSLNESIPDCPGRPSLRMLDLSSNRLSGNLPKSMGQLINLEYLDVSINSLKGVISDVHFQNLTHLTYLDLSFNSFALNLSSIPFQLTTIKMQSCKLGPSFPMWIQTQTDFAHLDISSSGISDSIPAWFWHLPRGLKFLNLSSNGLKGRIPEITSFFKRYPGIDLSRNQLEGRIQLLPSKLAALNLSGNRFSGTLSFLCQFDVALTFLDLSNYLLSGGFPDCRLKFGNRLVVLNLSNNNLTGEIPSSLGFLSQLEALYLRSNDFVGELPMSLSTCKNLRFLDLGENKFSGNIPSWIGETLSELYVLVLRSNTFNGSLPSQLCRLNNLQFLDLSKNGFLGNIPRCFSNFTTMARRGSRDNTIYHSYSSYVGLMVLGALDRTNPAPCLEPSGRYIDCGSNEEALFIDNALVAWKGTDREFGRGLLLLKGIDLSNNKFSGKVPDEITSLGELVSLNLAVNELHGEIPKDMGRMKSLESLDLSRNELSGNIPSSLSEITFLSYLDLSNNGFSGRIPSGPQLQRFDASVYSGNPQLCGPPIPQKCEPDHPPPTVDHEKEDDEEDGDDLLKSYYTGLGAGFAVGFCGICGALFFNRWCRYFVFASLTHMKEWIWVKVVVHFRKLQRKFRK